MTRHLKTERSDIPEVAKALGKKRKEQELEFERLRRLGNYHHNLRVYDRKQGTLIVLRRSILAKKAEDYLPCLYCCGFVSEAGLWYPVKTCKYRPLVMQKEKDEDEEGKEASIISRSRTLLAGSLTLYKVDHSNYKNLKEKVVSKMRDSRDGVLSIINNDDLILHFGMVKLERSGESRQYHIASKMKQLGRLVKKVHELCQGKQVSLMECIKPQMFDVIIRATKSLSGNVKQKTKNGVQISKSPSFGLQVGHSLRKCVMLKKGRAIRLRDYEMKCEAQEFDILLQSEWTDKVSAPALQTLKERKYYKEEEILDSSDLAKLNAYSSHKVTEGIKCLHEEPNLDNWINLSKAVFIACTVFNHRRSGEVAKMPTTSFTKRPARGKVNGEILNSLTGLEKKLLER